MKSKWARKYTHKHSHTHTHTYKHTHTHLAHCSVDGRMHHHLCFLLQLKKEAYNDSHLPIFECARKTGERCTCVRVAANTSWPNTSFLTCNFVLALRVAALPDSLPPLQGLMASSFYLWTSFRDFGIKEMITIHSSGISLIIVKIRYRNDFISNKIFNTLNFSWRSISSYFTSWHFWIFIWSS